MKGFVTNIEQAALTNEYFRQVLYTDQFLQVVVMALRPGEDIGLEAHDLDQFIRVEAGNGKAVLDGEEHNIADGSAIVVPAGVQHNIINGTGAPMKLYTIYTPPNHPAGTVHQSKAEAEAAEAKEHEHGN